MYIYTIQIDFIRIYIININNEYTNKYTLNHKLKISYTYIYIYVFVYVNVFICDYFFLKSKCVLKTIDIGYWDI